MNFPMYPVKGSRRAQSSFVGASPTIIRGAGWGPVGTKASFKSCIGTSCELLGGDGNKLAKSFVGIKDILFRGFTNVEGKGAVYK